MCRFKSAIILKDRVFITDEDSHTDLLENLKIADTRENAEKLFVRAELYPGNEDIFSDINNWVFSVDQDILPEWFVREYDRKRMIEAVKKWSETHIYIDKKNIKVSGRVYINNCKHVTACGNSTVEAYDNSTVKAYGDSKVEAYDNSLIIISSYSSNKKDNIILYKNSTLKDCKTKTIYQSGNWTFKTEEQEH